VIIKNEFLHPTIRINDLSIFKGLTSEGGGSVAFPVMTLAFKIPPFVARDFTLNLQAIGMCAATFTICWMRVSFNSISHSFITN